MSAAESPLATYHMTQLGDPVWVRIGQGWCAAQVIHIRRTHAVVKFVTGAREKAEWGNMRFRKDREL